jgi:peroxiredoxin
VVIGKDGKIAYTELVPEITQEPDYDKAIAACKAIQPAYLPITSNTKTLL